jgi:hypothetical protein
MLVTRPLPKKADLPKSNPTGEIINRKAIPPIQEEESTLVEVGQWYWVKRKKESDFFGCVVKVGSNFIEIRNPYDSYIRIHLDEFHKKCRREHEPEKIIRQQITLSQGVVSEKLGRIKEITARLGLNGQGKVEQSHPEVSRALSVLSSTVDPKQYKKSLIKAKETDLPALFKEVEEAHSEMTRWMKAQAIPMRAMAEGMKGCIGEIEDRVFNVSLYAGLTEEVVEISSGEPAAYAEKLHILQRLLYMDEECLINYRHGGMDFQDIEEFDKWLAEPANRDRVLPFPRSLVAFRVRRETKDRDWGGSVKQLFINFDLKELDKLTFLYFRNGEYLYRMNCDLEFGELIFPGRHELDLNEPMMAKISCGDVEDVIPKRTHDDLLKKFEDGEKKYGKWKKANPKGEHYKNPFWEFSHDRESLNRYQPFNKTSVYYDEIQKEIGDRIKQYNRIALIVQGLFDRSPVFHPHPPVQLWKPEGFSAAVELIYDGSGILHYGEAPDFEAYRQVCNASLKEGCVTIGQDDYWAEKEGERECVRRDRDWRTKSEYRPERFRPHGNPGPGYLAKIQRWLPRSRKAVFAWNRDRRSYYRYGAPKGPITASLSVPDSRLFNVDAYKLGDYKKFFADPRTRAQYLKWAPMLIAAEEHHAGIMPKEKVWASESTLDKADEA